MVSEVEKVEMIFNVIERVEDLKRYLESAIRGQVEASVLVDTAASMVDEIETLGAEIMQSYSVSDKTRATITDSISQIRNMLREYSLHKLGIRSIN